MNECLSTATYVAVGIYSAIGFAFAYWSIKETTRLRRSTDELIAENVRLKTASEAMRARIMN